MNNYTPEQLAELKVLRAKAYQAYADHEHDMKTNREYRNTVKAIQKRAAKKSLGGVRPKVAA